MSGRRVRGAPGSIDVTTRDPSGMAHVATGSVVRQLGALFEGGSLAGLSDRQLLERYAAGAHEPAGEAAFAALVARHGPMVLGVCRQLLRGAQHPEAALQADFLRLPHRG